MKKTRFCMQESVTKGVPTPCTEEMFLAALNDKDVKNITDRIAGLNPDDSKYSDKKNALKRKLPIITPHSFAFGEDGKRSSANAVPSGLAMLDIDNVASPRDVYTMQVEPFVEGLKIYFAAITPSGHGLRLIFERQRGESIRDAMMRIASACDFEEIDAVTYDLARASYMVPQDYVLYMNTNGLFAFPDEETEAYWLGIFKNPRGAIVEAQAEKEQESTALPIVRAEGEQRTNCLPNANATAGVKSPCGEETDMRQGVVRNEAGEAMFKGVRYADIVRTLIERSGGEPTNGERNTYYFGLAKQVRYICDFNASLVCEVLPDFGLSEEERRGECERACKAVRKTYTPQEVLTAVSVAQVAQRQDIAEIDSETKDLPMPKLPRLLQLICRRLPEDFRPTMVIAALPVLGALATKVRFDYLDNQEHSFSFFSCICAPQATGKGAFRRSLDLLLTPILEQDEVEWQKEQDYREKMKTSKNSKNLPKDPHACPRNIGVSASVAKLLQLMTYSEGRHLVGICEEMDMLSKAEKNSWSSKSEILRLAFDNGELVKANMSESSFNTKVKVYYNLCLAGTPGAMKRFFSDLEDGLVSRVCFTQLPDMRYSKMPVIEPYTDAEKEEIIQWARMLDGESGTIRCEAVRRAIDQWVEEKRILCDAADSLAGDILRRRAAVIGFRAGMMAYLLEGKSGKRTVAEFAAWVAEYVWRNQMALWGNQLEQQNQNGDSGYHGSVKSLVDMLPEEFTTNDLVALRIKKGQSTAGEAIRKVLHRWRRSGIIEHRGQGRWVKTGKTLR